MAPTILIADDTAVNRALLSSILRRERFDILEAVDGDAALELCSATTPDLVLLDIMMPGKDGFEVCSRLKEDPTTADVPIIFLSALGDVEAKVKGLDLGAVDYVTKPFDRWEVLARVRTQLRIRELTQSLKRLNADLLMRQRILDEDLRAAAQIQRALLPRRQLRLSGLSVAWRFAPCEAIGGDIFNILPMEGGSVALYVLDVSGHGVPSALVTVSVSQELAAIVGPTGNGAASSPRRVLEALDDEYPVERFEKHFTICYMVLDPERGLLRYSSAGHPPPILLRRDGATETLGAGGSVIGLGLGVPFDEEAVELGPGDRVFVFTDGIEERPAASGEFFGRERLLHTLQAYRDRSLGEACDALMRSLGKFAAGEPPRDDVSLVGVEYREPERRESA